MSGTARGIYKVYFQKFSYHFKSGAFSKVPVGKKGR